MAPLSKHLDGNTMSHYLAILAGVIFAGLGGELFVRGLLGIARRAGISAGIIGSTLAAFATSSPELSVAISAALAGEPEISLGDALGSNINNIALILGVTLLISGIYAPRDSVKRDFPLAVATPFVVGLLSFDGTISRIDGLVLLGIFLTWLVATAREIRRQKGAAAAEAPLTKKGWAAFSLCLFGLALLIAAGQFIVMGAKGIATDLGIDEFIIGSTVVALGTSMPELATAIISKIKQHEEVGLGTVLGSNIFNSFFIVPVAAMITPISVARDEVALALLFGLLAVLFIYPAQMGLIRRRRGILLLLLYAFYVFSMSLK